MKNSNDTIGTRNRDLPTCNTVPHPTATPRCTVDCFWRDSPQWAMASSFTRFLDHTQRRTIVGKESSGRVIRSSQRNLPDNTHNTHNRQTSMTPMEFEPTISAGELPQTYAVDRAATGTGDILLCLL